MKKAPPIIAAELAMNIAENALPPTPNSRMNITDELDMYAISATYTALPAMLPETKARFRSASAQPAKNPPLSALPERVSFKNRNVQIADRIPAIPVAQNMCLHERSSLIMFPAAGPASGATLCVIDSMENASSIFPDGKASVMTAREITTGAQPKNAWKNLAIQNVSMSPAAAQTNETAENSASDASMGSLLPILSDSGPQKSCPTANPPKNTEREAWTL